MFKKVKNIETAFQSIRWMAIVAMVLSFAYAIFTNIQYHKQLKKDQSTLYILAAGKALEAFASDINDDIPVEARDHITVFHQAFFTLSPDERKITKNITKALYLSDESAKRMYDNLKEKGYYADVISSNISQEVGIDSIHLETNSYPFYFRCYAQQKIIRSTSTVTRSLITEGYLRRVSRSDNNPHGFLISRWNILENNDIKVEAKD
jgi:conjugative transposon TraK protein